MPGISPLRRSRTPSPDFENLLRPQIGPLFRLAYRFTGSVADAEDLVQDVLIKLYPRTRELQAIEQLRPWLARVLYRQFVDFARKRGRTPSNPSADGAADEDGDPMDRLPATGDGPEESAERSLRHEHILEALERLNPEQRALLALHDVEGYSLEELEPLLDTPLGTLKSRLHRARRRLRALLPVEPFSAYRRV